MAVIKSGASTDQWSIDATSKAGRVTLYDTSGSPLSLNSVQYADGVTQVTPTGTVALGKNPSNILHALSLDASGNLNVNLTASLFDSTIEGSPATRGLNVHIQNASPISVSGTVGVTQSTSPWVVSLASTTITGSVTVAQATAANLNATVVGTGTFAVQAAQSGTWNIGTLTTITNPVTVVGDAASGSAKAGNPVQGGAVFNTTQPTVTNGQVVENQATARGGLIVATGVDTFHVTVDNATLAVTQSTSPWVVSLTSTTITGTVAVTQSTSPWTVQGDSASGAANAGNPVKTGGVFNTTQPTVTNGQTVDNQSTARGGLIVATGVDTFNVTVNAALPAGTNVIGHVITDSGSTTVVTGSVTVAQATAANLNATVVGTGTFAVQATQSGTWTDRIVGNTGATLDSTVAAGTAPTNGLAILSQFNTTIPTPTAAQTVALQSDSTGALAINEEGRKQSYRVGVVGFTIIAQGANTSPAISITGSATKTIRITRILFSATAATGAVADIQLRRFSALTGGTANSQAANVAKMDTNNAAQTAVVNQWSAAATTATNAGIFAAKRYEIVTAAVSVLPGEIEWKFGDTNGQACVLRGTSDFVGICASAVGTTPVGDCWVEWTEE